MSSSEEKAPEELMADILASMGITQYEPRVVNMLVEYAKGNTHKSLLCACAWVLSFSPRTGNMAEILADAQDYAEHRRRRVRGFRTFPAVKSCVLIRMRLYCTYALISIHTYSST
jgi:hypothetical protein